MCFRVPVPLRFRGVGQACGLRAYLAVSDQPGDDRIDAVPVDGFHAARCQREGDAPAERRHEITFALQVRFEAAADFPM